MITLQAFCEYLRSFLQPSLFADYCPNGLQVEGAPTISRFATAVSASCHVIEEAIKHDVQALIVHHGIFWNRDSYVIEGVKKKKIEMLLSHGISLIAYHLPLDAHQSVGNNWKAAKDLGWGNLLPFCMINGIPLGVKGEFHPVKVQEFQNQLEMYYRHPATVALGGKDLVTSAALISGGAYKNISDAIIAGVDCYVTGNYDEPAWHIAKEENINFFALGHSATERVGPSALMEYLIKNLHLEGVFIDEENPF